MRLVAVLCLLIMISCSEKQEVIPKDVLPPQQMEAVFWDYLQADAYGALLQFDTVKEDTVLNLQMQEVIFKHHKTSKEQFYRSYKYYIGRPKLMEVIIDSMLAEQGRKTKEKAKFDLKISE